MATTGQIDPELVAGYERDGYLVVEDLVTGRQLEDLREALEAVATDTAAYPDVKRQWFEREGQRFVGHVFHQHQHHPAFRALTQEPTILAYMQALMGCRPRLYTSQLMLKGPRENSHVFQPHQDWYYWQFMPAEVVTCWFAFDDATAENGCLTVVPGSHREGLLEHTTYESSIGDAAGKKAGLWGVSEAAMAGRATVRAPVRAGGAVFFHSLTIHASGGNTTDGWRRAGGLIYMPENHAGCLAPQQLAMGW